MNLKQKVISSLAAGTLLLGAFVPAAWADTSIQIIGNGSRSFNEAEINSRISSRLEQRNEADFHNNVHFFSNTGGNIANDNTGGSTRIFSGDSNSSVRISNQANLNQIGFSNGSTSGGNSHVITGGYSSFQTTLTGHQEIPGPGDQDGFGSVKIQLNQSNNRVCSDIWVANIAAATAAHIHKGAFGVAGPVVVTLPTPNSSGFASSCQTIDSDLLKDIQNNPANYYVNVHNADYPNGAIRGQL